MDIVKLLRREYAPGEVLEISTPTTGLTFSELKNAVPDAHRLVDNCPDGVDDGQTYTYRTDARISGLLTNAILAANRNAPCYDIVFVDPFHTYDCSTTDLAGAYALLRSGGVMVVHDCNLECATLTVSEFVPGDWLGVTYVALIDFILGRGELGFYTVDTNFGCGVVCKDRKLPRGSSPVSNGAREHLTRAWNATWHDDAARFEFFAQHRHDLLNLIASRNSPRSSVSRGRKTWWRKQYGVRTQGQGRAGDRLEPRHRPRRGDRARRRRLRRDADRPRRQGAQ